MATTMDTGVPVAASVGAGPAINNGRQTQLPEFIPLPREGQVEFYSGLRRSTINLLVLPCPANNQKPPVKSINMRRPGLTKGKRLVVLEGRFGDQYGLLTYLRKLRDEPSDEVFAANAKSKK